MTREDADALARAAGEELGRAAALLDQGRFADAMRPLRRAIALAPAHGDAVFFVALARHQAGLVPEIAYRRVLALAPGHIGSSINLAGWLAEAGRSEAALTLLRRVAVLEPSIPQALGNLALSLRRWEPLAQQAVRLRRILAVADADASTLLNLGDVLIRSGRIAPAIAAMRHALRVAPGFAEAHHGLALALQRDVPAAASASEMQASLRRACAIHPGFAGAWASAGSAAIDEDGARAARLLLRALAVDRQERTALGSLGNLLRRQGRPDDARRRRQQLVALEPEVGQGFNNLALSVLDYGDIGSATRYLRRALALEPDRGDFHSNLLFSLVYDPALPEADLFAEYRRWAVRHVGPLPQAARPHSNLPDPARQLCVGYLSADFRDHAIAWLVEGLFAAHDLAQVEIACYAEVPRPDAVTERLKRHARIWRSTVGLSDAEVAATIRNDSVDMLVVLGGHTAGNRLLAAAARPAPIQINLHDLSTSGLQQVDYWLTDPALHPESGTAEGMTERPLRIPSLYLHVPPGAPIPPTPPAASINGHVTFGSFSNPAKLNDRVLALWASILRDLPGSRLSLGYLSAFTDPAVRRSFETRFARLGIGAERLTFLGPEADRARHVARIPQLDIALDPFPFNGGITTFEALWAGVPVVTLAGNRFAGRCGVSHLTQVGLESLIAQSEADYRRIAVDLARDVDRLTDIRRTLGERVRTSRLVDADRYARSVEAAYRSIWTDWCARRSSRSA